MKPFTLEDFVRESNRIEGVERDPTAEELSATQQFLGLPHLGISPIVELVRVYQPNARPRFASGMDVRVGGHIAPLGGPRVQEHLMDMLRDLRSGPQAAYLTHLAYEGLHPFMDGNGRSGRAIWLWQMGGVKCAPLGFLHTFYYQTLWRQAGAMSGTKRR